MNDWSHILPLSGWCTEEKMQRLYDLVTESDSMITVELGVFGGRSLFPMAIAHKDKDSGKAFGFDPYVKEACVEGTNDPKNDEWWQSVDLEGIYKDANDFIVTNHLENYCALIRERSDEAYKHFQDDTIDILHQDSNHNTETITKELELWIPKIKVGGYWINDDCDWKESQTGYAKLPDYGLELVEDFIKWQIWKKK